MTSRPSRFGDAIGGAPSPCGSGAGWAAAVDDVADALLDERLQS